jgi:NAD(P)-dependent dehydrogenase (short-subunit alcohol dehydrogenase family)
LQAAAQGYRVAVNYRRQAAAAEAVVAGIVEGGGTAVAIKGDVADEDDVRKIFTELDRHYGTINGLVNNAGINGNKSTVADFSAERLERLFAVNVFGTILCCREAVRRMSTQKGGRGG